MIRAATKDDLQAVYGLMKQLSHHKFTEDQFKFCYFYNLANNCILVCEENGCICGCGILTIYYSLHFSQKSAEIVNLIVDENVRSRGIGKELLLSLEQIAIDNGCVCLELSSGKQREAAHRFYEREGFVSSHYKFTKGLI